MKQRKKIKGENKRISNAPGKKFKKNHSSHYCDAAKQTKWNKMQTLVPVYLLFI